MAKRLLTSFKDHQNWTIVHSKASEANAIEEEAGYARSRADPETWDPLEQENAPNHGVIFRNTPVDFVKLRTSIWKCMFPHFPFSMRTKQVIKEIKYCTIHIFTSLLQEFFSLTSIIVLSLAQEKMEIDCSKYFSQNSTSRRR